MVGIVARPQFTDVKLANASTGRLNISRRAVLAQFGSLCLLVRFRLPWF